MSKKFLLLVDDEVLFQKLLQPHLERAGFTTIVAGNGVDAIFLAISEHPQIIVLDILMPGIDGLEALRRLKSTESTREIPVLIISSTIHQATLNEAQSCGAVSFLTKPFSPAQLLSEINRVVSFGTQHAQN